MTVEIKSDRLIVCSFQKNLITDRYIRWLNDKQVVKYSEQRHRHHTRTSCTKYYESFKGTNNLFLSIILKEGLSHIGNVTVTLDQYNGIADIAIMIGEKKVWGKGLGKEAWSLTLEYLMGRKDVRKITAGTMSVNVPMLSIMKASGMMEEGVKEAQFILDGHEVDLVFFSNL
jgi:[ribosomal protein S5]-alanine N-acetyltransferase